MAKQIDIADLLEPKLDTQQKQALAYAESKPVVLSVESLLDTAREATGLTDFGPDDFRERLQRLVDEWNADTRMTALNRMILSDMMRRQLANRLLLIDTLKHNPAINDEVIDRPIIVVGLPRSGTTHLLNLLAADSRLRSLPLWLAEAPIPNPKEQPGPDGVDPRYARAAKRWENMQQSSPLTAAMHPMDPDHFHEDLELMCPDVASYHHEWGSRMPGWRDYYCSTDQTPHYEWMKTTLKALQFGQGPTRWVNKCPQHLEQLRVLKKVFPDATVVITYRDPIDAIQSAAVMMGYAERMRYPEIDAQGLLDYWTDRVERLLRACVRDRDIWPDAQRVDVPFEDFMRDEMTVVHAVQDKAGLPRSEKAEAEIAQFVANHPRGKFGQVVYHLERDFGVSRAELRKRFDFYFEAFPFLRRPEN